MQVRSALLDAISGIRYGFGTTQEPVTAQFQGVWESLRPRHKQVHQCQFAFVESANQACGDVDSLFTCTPHIPVGVMTADCVPILMANRQGTWVAAVHAGWRGTRNHIVRVLWEELQKKGERPENWVAAIGPAIGPCCYEVSPELAQEFRDEFKALDGSGDLAVPKDRYLNLPRVNAAELKSIGLKSVEILEYCTRCSVNPSFHSYRREGSGTRQWSIIEARKSPSI